MPNSNLIRGAEAVEIIAGIEDPAMRVPIHLLTQALVDYHRENPSELLGSFDLVFFVNVLKETTEHISGLLRGTTPVDYWFDDYPRPNADETTDTGPFGIRWGRAFNFAARQSDIGLQTTLLTLTTRVFVKQIFHQDSSGLLVVPEAPVQLIDYLFLVKAVANALEPGQPARVFFEGTSQVSIAP